MERGGGGSEGDGSAAVLEGTQLCSTRQLRDMLPCLGGVALLLPFIAQVSPWSLPSGRWLFPTTMEFRAKVKELAEGLELRV